MEHIYFEVQLCINISNPKEISNIDILINLCLATNPEIGLLNLFIHSETRGSGCCGSIRLVKSV